MPQSSHIAAQSRALPYFERLWRHCLAPDLDFGTKVERLLTRETTEFGLEYGFLSTIDLEAEVQRFEIVAGSHRSIEPGSEVPLSTTYCQKTIADPDGTLVVSDALADGWDGDPAYERWGLGSYIGTTVRTDGELYGTLCFADSASREDPITDAERSILEMHGHWMSHELDRWSDPSIGDPAGAAARECDVSSPQLDSVFNAINKQARRFVLIDLLNDTGNDTVDILERTTADDRAAIELYHTHLPALEQAGYIEWDQDSNAVSRGPNYPEIEPFLRVLEESTMEFPR